MTKLIHERSGRAVVEDLEIARRMFSRMRGLLGRASLPPNGGMLIERCASIHTFFMRFPLDVVFLDADFTVRKVVRGLRPWRLAAALGASHVVELPAGRLAEVPVAAGDKLVVMPA